MGADHRSRAFGGVGTTRRLQRSGAGFREKALTAVVVNNNGGTTMAIAHRCSSTGSLLQAIGSSVCGAALLVAFSLHANAQTLPPRDLPARTIPVPETVSPQMQKIIGAAI